MLDKIAFMETLHSVQEVARTSLTPLTKEEIQTYFKDMELTKEQEDMVYQYLLHPQEEQPTEVENEAETETTETEEKKEENTAEPKPVSARFQMYLDELGDIPNLTKEQEQSLYDRLAAGEESVIAELSHQWLKKVVEIASAYEVEDVLLDDMVQEGNIGLLMGLQSLAGKKEAEPEKVLEQMVRTAIEGYVDEESGEGEQENSILAKVSLVHEAKEALAKKIGMEPSIRQLAEYTKISEEEISDIVSLAKEVKQGE
ncbi:MAG: hypothetical protein GX284_10420 [Clostridiales bacterium]|nr:hypothetical protein [Clostridiales bacterium]